MIDLGGSAALAGLISGTLLAFASGWIAPDFRTLASIYLALVSSALISSSLKVLT